MTAKDIVEFFTAQGISLLKGLLVLAAGLFAVHWVVKLLNRWESKLRMEPTVRSFLLNLTKWTLYVLVIFTAASVLGVPMTSMLTLVASAGVAVSLAMQGALSNLVGGVLLLILKPIRADEYVKIGDHEGTVRAIGAFYTELVTFDGKHVSLPNSALTNTPIVNYTREGVRRLDASFTVGYDADLDLVYRTLRDMMEQNGRLLPDPAPAVLLNAYGENGLVFVVRVWCKTADYWPVYFDFMDRGKRALDAAGLAIPYPQMDVHIKSEAQETPRP